MLAKATITDTLTNIEVTCQFRPEKYTITKANNYESSNTPGKSSSPPQFLNGGPLGMTLELLFDNYEKDALRDVRLETKKLWAMMDLSPKKVETGTNKGEPPHVVFRWGTTWSFKAVIESISQTFTLFDPDGTPVRSTVTITFKQGIEENVFPNTNPTSGGFHGYAVHTVTEGETIDLIAFQEYGSSSAWRHLASSNNLDDPTRLLAGQKLVLVPLDV
jgi:hypothetical protein